MEFRSKLLSFLLCLQARASLSRKRAKLAAAAKSVLDEARFQFKLRGGDLSWVPPDVVLRPEQEVDVTNADDDDDDDEGKVPHLPARLPPDSNALSETEPLSVADAPTVSGPIACSESTLSTFHDQRMEDEEDSTVVASSRLLLQSRAWETALVFVLHCIAGLLPASTDASSPEKLGALARGLMSGRADHPETSGPVAHPAAVVFEALGSLLRSSVHITVSCALMHALEKVGSLFVSKQKRTEFPFTRMYWLRTVVCMVGLRMCITH